MYIAKSTVLNGILVGLYPHFTPRTTLVVTTTMTRSETDKTLEIKPAALIYINTIEDIGQLALGKLRALHENKHRLGKPSISHFKS